GNGYSQEWETEAKKRGLSNTNNVLIALESFLAPKSIKLLEKHNILSEKEIKARYEVLIEKYKKQIQIESRILGDIVLNHIIPAVLKHQNMLIENVKGMKDIFVKSEYDDLTKARRELIKDISIYISQIKQKAEEMRLARKDANNSTDCVTTTRKYIDNVKPFLEEIRLQVDKLERVVDNELWPLPKYRELLYSH
ncbi:MAG: glutamine synthetase type III, partial [Bacteroidota bacterium]|nr:glutamine synthetase type III [Bacteroidota bacterium]